MRKSKELWILGDGGSYVATEPWESDDQLHVIEFAAYDELLNDYMKLLSKQQSTEANYQAEKERAGKYLKICNDSDKALTSWAKEYSQLKSQAEKLATALDSVNRCHEIGIVKEALSHWTDFKKGIE